MLIAGVRMPPAGRSAGRSSANGSGTCACTWDMLCIPLPCAPRSLPLPPSLPSLPLPFPPLPLPAMNHPSLRPPGSATGCPVRTLFPNPMARCAVLPTILSTRRNGARSVMEPCGSCMPPASAIVVLVRYANAASGMALLPHTHGASAWCCIPTARHPSSRTHRRNRRLWLLSPSCGETGSVASIDESGSSFFASSVSTSDSLKRPHRPSPRPLDPFPVRSEQDFRLSWAERLARNAVPSGSPSISITLFGVPDAFAQSIGLQTL